MALYDNIPQFQIHTHTIKIFSAEMNGNEKRKKKNQKKKHRTTEH